MMFSKKSNNQRLFLQFALILIYTSKAYTYVIKELRLSNLNSRLSITKPSGSILTSCIADFIIDHFSAFRILHSLHELRI